MSWCERAPELATLRLHPGNQLEALKGNRKGQHGIRVNDQRRVCFVWQDDGGTSRRNRGLPLGVEDMGKLLDEIHPGEILLGGFMKPMEISARELAADIDVSPSRVGEIVNGQRPITADTALRLGLFFGMEPRFWLNLQTEYDMRVANRDLRDKIAPRIRAFAPVAA